MPLFYSVSLIGARCPYSVAMPFCISVMPTWSFEEYKSRPITFEITLTKLNVQKEQIR